MTGHDCAACRNPFCVCHQVVEESLPGVTPDESIIDELKAEHGITIVTLPCPCTGAGERVPDPACPHCRGTGLVEYSIQEVRFS